jgi:hypothetical protein
MFGFLVKKIFIFFISACFHYYCSLKNEIVYSFFGLSDTGFMQIDIAYYYYLQKICNGTAVLKCHVQKLLLKSDCLNARFFLMLLGHFSYFLLEIFQIQKLLFTQ